MRKPRLDSDRAARRLISHRRMAADLVRLLGDRWIEDVDLDRLERLPSEHVSPARRSRREDMPWWTPFKAGAGYGPSAKVLFQIEFQSRPDTFMAERMLEYNAMLRLDLLRAGTGAEVSRLLTKVDGQEQVATVAALIVDCEDGPQLIRRLRALPRNPSS